MLKSAMRCQRPLHRALARSDLMHVYGQPFAHHLQPLRSQHLGAKSLHRSQSTLQPRIEFRTQQQKEPTRQGQQTQKDDGCAVTTTIQSNLQESMIPSYLEETYWWAYTTENAVRFWERQWLVDAILWGNFNALKTEAINEVLVHSHEEQHPPPQTFNVTQIACVYGNFSTDLVATLMSSRDDEEQSQNRAYRYNIIDVAPVQLRNTKSKIDAYLTLHKNITHGTRRISIDVVQNDSSDMKAMEDGTQDVSYLFFLLHEQPKHVRLQTIAETIRITKENGKIVIVDYHKPTSDLNPFRYIMYPILTYLEPFAIDLWQEQITDYIADLNEKHNWKISMDKKIYFGGLYQKIVLIKRTL